MTSDSLTRPDAGHDATNQPPPLAGYDVCAADPGLRESVHRGGAPWPGGSLPALGSPAGDPHRIKAGTLADAHPPGAAHARPVRAPDRRGPLPPALARTDVRRARPRMITTASCAQRPLPAGQTTGVLLGMATTENL